jgi:hypothetical protein
MTTNYIENSLQVDEISQVRFDRFPCVPETVVPAELENTVELRILDVRCDETAYSARMILENHGPKALKGYEIETVFDPADPSGNISGGQSSEDGVLHAPGQSMIIKFDIGYGRGISDKPQNTSPRMRFFLIIYLEYSDGTIWQVGRQL